MNILIIGYGSIGKRHREVLEGINPKYSVSLVTKQPIQGVCIYPDIVNVNDLEKFEYFIISSETVKHFEQLEYLNSRINGRKILVEKPIFYPMNHTLAEIHSEIYCGYNLRFHPLIKGLREKLTGQKVLNVNIIAGQYLPDWRPGRDYRDIYSSDSERGGGVLNDLSHEIDYLQWLFGRIVKVSAINRKISNLEINSDDYAGILGITEKGVIVNITLEYISRMPIRRIIINTEKNTYDVDIIRNEMRSFQEGIIIEKRLENYERNYTYREMHKAIIEGNGSNVATYHDAVEVLKTISLIKNSDKKFDDN